jgi:hypothetical protein
MTSVRRYFDSDGRLHVTDARISKAGISRYRGDEIPGWRLLGLDGGRDYRMLRHPDELAMAAATFRGIPLLSKHAELDGPHRPELVVGTVSDCRFHDPFLLSSVTVWARSAIDGIADGSKRELSCAYEYLPSMTPGVFRGHAYDGVIRDCRGLHCALVERTRAGSDCVIKLDTEDIDDRRFAAA